MDILEKAKSMEAAGIDIVHFEIGEPDFDTPEPIKKAGIEAIRKGKTKYTHSLGLHELRKAVAKHTLMEYGVGVDPERVFVASGTSNALFLILAAMLEKGDEVIMPDPCYSCYPNFVSFLGGKPVKARVREKDRFELTPEMVAKKITGRTRAILINSPANPTGMVIKPDVIREITRLGPMIISDEIYHGIVYDSEAHSVLEYTDNAFVINGFSKRNAMTGWRLGYAICPPEYVRPIQKMQQNFNISANSFVQWGGIAALQKGGPYVEKMRKVLDERRRFLVRGLADIGLGLSHPPQGAFYAFTNASKNGKNSMKLALEILDKAHVAVTPGIDFGKGGEGYLRFSYTSSIDNIREGIKRLDGFLNTGG